MQTMLIASQLRGIGTGALFFTVRPSYTMPRAETCGPRKLNNARK